MSHIKLESPRGDPHHEGFDEFTGDIFSTAGETKKGKWQADFSFASLWRKSKKGKKSPKKSPKRKEVANDDGLFEAEQVDSLHSRASQEVDWTLDMRDEMDTSFDELATRLPTKNTELGFPPLPPPNFPKPHSCDTSIGDTSQGQSRGDRKTKRKLNPTVVLSRRKADKSEKSKDLSLTKMISQSFDSETSSTSGRSRDDDSAASPYSFPRHRTAVPTSKSAKPKNTDSPSLKAFLEPNSIIPEQHSETASTSITEEDNEGTLFGEKFTMSPMHSLSEEVTDAQTPSNVDDIKMDVAIDPESVSQSPFPPFHDRLSFYKTQFDQSSTAWESKRTSDSVVTKTKGSAPLCTSEEKEFRDELHPHDVVNDGEPPSDCLVKQRESSVSCEEVQHTPVDAEVVLSDRIRKLRLSFEGRRSSTERAPMKSKEGQDVEEIPSATVHPKGGESTINMNEESSRNSPTGQDDQPAPIGEILVDSDSDKDHSHQPERQPENEADQVESSIPSFRDRLCFYKTQSVQALAPWEKKNGSAHRRSRGSVETIETEREPSIPPTMTCVTSVQTLKDAALTECQPSEESEECPRLMGGPETAETVPEATLAKSHFNRQSNTEDCGNAKDSLEDGNDPTGRLSSDSGNWRLSDVSFPSIKERKRSLRSSLDSSNGQHYRNEAEQKPSLRTSLGSSNGKAFIEDRKSNCEDSTPLLKTNTVDAGARAVKGEPGMSTTSPLLEKESSEARPRDSPVRNFTSLAARKAALQAKLGIQDMATATRKSDRISVPAEVQQDQSRPSFPDVDEGTSSELDVAHPVEDAINSHSQQLTDTETTAAELPSKGTTQGSQSCNQQSDVATRVNKSIVRSSFGKQENVAPKVGASIPATDATTTKLGFPRRSGDGLLAHEDSPRSAPSVSVRLTEEHPKDNERNEAPPGQDTNTCRTLEALRLRSISERKKSLRTSWGSSGVAMGSKANHQMPEKDATCPEAAMEIGSHVTIPEKSGLAPVLSSPTGEVKPPETCNQSNLDTPDNNEDGQPNRRLPRKALQSSGQDFTSLSARKAALQGKFGVKTQMSDDGSARCNEYSQKSANNSVDPIHSAAERCVEDQEDRKGPTRESIGGSHQPKSPLHATSANQLARVTLKCSTQGRPEGTKAAASCDGTSAADSRFTSLAARKLALQAKFGPMKGKESTFEGEPGQQVRKPTPPVDEEAQPGVLEEDVTPLPDEVGSQIRTKWGKDNSACRRHESRAASEPVDCLLERGKAATSRDDRVPKPLDQLRDSHNSPDMTNSSESNPLKSSVVAMPDAFHFPRDGSLVAKEVQGAANRFSRTRTGGRQLSSTGMAATEAATTTTNHTSASTSTHPSKWRLPTHRNQTLAEKNESRVVAMPQLPETEETTAGGIPKSQTLSGGGRHSVATAKASISSDAKNYGEKHWPAFRKSAPPKPTHAPVLNQPCDKVEGKARGGNTSKPKWAERAKPANVGSCRNYPPSSVHSSVHEDYSMSSSRLGGSSRTLFANTDHPMFVTIDTSNDGSDALSLRSLEPRQVVCDPQDDRLPYIGGLEESANDSRNTGLPEDGNESLSESSIGDIAELRAAKTRAEAQNPSTRNIFVKKSHPWKKTNAAGRYLEKRRTESSSFEGEGDCLEVAACPNVQNTAHRLRPLPSFLSPKWQRPTPSPIVGAKNASTPLPREGTDSIAVAHGKSNNLEERNAHFEHSPLNKPSPVTIANDKCSHDESGLTAMESLSSDSEEHNNVSPRLQGSSGATSMAASSPSPFTSRRGFTNTSRPPAFGSPVDYSRVF